MSRKSRLGAYRIELERIMRDNNITDREFNLIIDNKDNQLNTEYNPKLRRRIRVLYRLLNTQQIRILK